MMGNTEFAMFRIHCIIVPFRISNCDEFSATKISKGYTQEQFLHFGHSTNRCLLP